jgi:hypothetical protein
MSGNNGSLDMSAIAKFFGFGGPSSTDTSLGVPNYSGFDTSNLQGPTQSGMPLSANPTGMGAPGTMGSMTGPGTTLGLNTGTGQLAVGGLQTLGNLWNAYQSNALAQKTFNFNKDLTNTNLANQTQAYNTTLAGQATARSAQENQSPQQALDFINANKLTNKTIG